MFKVIKRLEFSAAHHLALPYPSECSHLHGHNYWVEITLSAPDLGPDKMVMDFTKIKAVVNQIDHRNLNEYINGNPTAENIACYLAEEIQNACREGVQVESVHVQESEGNVAIWER